MLLGGGFRAASPHQNQKGTVLLTHDLMYRDHICIVGEVRQWQAEYNEDGTALLPIEPNHDQLVRPTNGRATAVHSLLMSWLD